MEHVTIKLLSFRPDLLQGSCFNLRLFQRDADLIRKGDFNLAWRPDAVYTLKI